MPARKPKAAAPQHDGLLIHSHDGHVYVIHRALLEQHRIKSLESGEGLKRLRYMFGKAGGLHRVKSAGMFNFGKIFEGWP